MKRFGPLWVIVGAALWGLMGVFTRHLTAMGLTTLQIAAVRCTVAAVAFVIITLIRDPKLLKIEWRDLPWLCGTGLFSVLLMTVTYALAIEQLPLSTAAILLYTAPVIVMVASVLFLKEPFSWEKPVALAAAFVGCVLVTGLKRGGTGLGILFGVISGAAYALYTLFGTVLLRRRHPLTVTTWSFAIGAVGALVLCDLPGLCHTLGGQPLRADAVLWLLGIGIETAVLPYLLYTLGLQYTGAGKAAVLSYAEPLTATLVGIAFYDEAMTWQTGLGILLILGAAVLMSRRSMKKEKNFSKKG